MEVRKCGCTLEKQCRWDLPRDPCAALRWMTFCLLLYWMSHCLHLTPGIKIERVVSKHNFWDARDKFYELYDLLPDRDVRWSTWGNGNCSTEGIWARNDLHKALCTLLLLGSHAAFGLELPCFSCTPCNILTPSLVTLTKWIKLCFSESITAALLHVKKQGFTRKAGDWGNTLALDINYRKKIFWSIFDLPTVLAHDLQKGLSGTK